MVTAATRGGLVVAPMTPAPAAVPTVHLRNGASFPLLALGTCCYAGCENEHGEDISTCWRSKALSSGRAWLALNATAVDMAQLYRNSPAIGQAVRESGVPRTRLFLETKCDGYLGFAGVIQCIDDALVMLGTSYLDAVLLHWPYTYNPECLFGTKDARGAVNPKCTDGGGIEENIFANKIEPPLDVALESWRALEVAFANGRVRAIGLSDHSVAQIRAIVESEHIVRQPDLLQTHCSAVRCNAALLDYCRRRGIQLQAWGALGGAADRWGGGVLDNPTLAQVAHESGLTVGQVAIRYLTQQGIAVVQGTATASHMAESLGTFGTRLTAESMAKIQALSTPPEMHRAAPATPLALAGALASSYAGAGVAVLVLVAAGLLALIRLVRSGSDTRRRGTNAACGVVL